MFVVFLVKFIIRFFLRGDGVLAVSEAMDSQSVYPEMGAFSHPKPEIIFFAGARTELHRIARAGARRRLLPTHHIAAPGRLKVWRPAAFANDRDHPFLTTLLPHTFSPREGDSHRVHPRSGRPTDTLRPVLPGAQTGAGAKLDTKKSMWA